MNNAFPLLDTSKVNVGPWENEPGFNPNTWNKIVLPMLSRLLENESICYLRIWYDALLGVDNIEFEIAFDHYTLKFIHAPFWQAIKNNNRGGRDVKHFTVDDDVINFFNDSQKLLDWRVFGSSRLIKCLVDTYKPRAEAIWGENNIIVPVVWERGNCVYFGTKKPRTKSDELANWDISVIPAGYDHTPPFVVLSKDARIDLPPPMSHSFDVAIEYALQDWQWNNPILAFLRNR